MTSVLFVCLGNICRSPLAEGIFRQAVSHAGLQDQFVIDSAGNGDWHAGDPPDARAIAIAQKNGIDISNQSSRPVITEDFLNFDLILCMDQGNIDRLNPIRARGTDHAHVDFFLHYSLGEKQAVADPYYGGIEGFDRVFNQIDKASQALLEKLK